MLRIIPFVAFLLIVFGCQNYDTIKTEPGPLNSFSMYVNNEFWEPSVIDNTGCYATYNCAESFIDGRPFYVIKAYRDPEHKTDPTSEHYFYLQVMNVNEIGTYEITEPFGDFRSSVLYEKNESGSTKKYANSIEKVSCFVTIDEIIPIEGASTSGIKGTFWGTLYNTEDPNDSITINNCAFTFKKTNWNNFNQCAE